MLLCTLVAGLHKVLGDIDPQHVRCKFRLRQRCRSITASEIQNLEPFGDSQALDERLSAFSHALCNAGEVAFFPKCLVWIHWWTPSRVAVEQFALRGRTNSKSPPKTVFRPRPRSVNRQPSIRDNHPRAGARDSVARGAPRPPQTTERSRDPGNRRRPRAPPEAHPSDLSVCQAGY